MEEIIESSINVEPVVNVEPQQTEPNNEPVNEPVQTNNVEPVEPQQEPTKPVQTAEDNAKYAAIRREAEQKAYTKAQDELIDQLYGESHGIHNKKQYDEAVKKAQEEAEIQSHIDKGIDPEIAKELAEMKRFKQQYEQEIQTKQQKEKQQRDFQEFLEAYPTVNASEIPSEVWQEVEKGTPLKLAYGLHENAILKAKLAEYEKGSKTQQINTTNAQTSTGSVTGNGTPNDGIISFETFEANKNDQNWIKKNFNKIMESRSKW